MTEEERFRVYPPDPHELARIREEYERIPKEELVRFLACAFSTARVSLTTEEVRPGLWRHTFTLTQEETTDPQKEEHA